MSAAIERQQSRQQIDEQGIEPATYTVKAAARRIGIAESFLYRQIQSGACPFPVLRIGRRVVVPRAALERYLAGGDAA